MIRFDNLYIPIGGVGSRLRVGLKEVEFSSKTFLVYRGRTLLERILKQFGNFCDNIQIVYCTERQLYDAQSVVKRVNPLLPISFVYNASSDPLAMLPETGDVLVVMGDTLVPEETVRYYIEFIKSHNKPTVMKMYHEGPDDAYYHFETNRICDYSFEYKEQYEQCEIGQLIFLPKKYNIYAREVIKSSNTLTLMRKLIKDDIMLYVDKECININTYLDYSKMESLVDEDSIC